MIQYSALGFFVLLAIGLAFLIRRRWKGMGTGGRIGLGLLVAFDLVGLLAVWWFWRTVEEVPEGGEVTAELDAEVDPLSVTFAAQGPLPALTLRDLKGKTAFFFVDDQSSNKEGTILRRAVNRWELPDSVVGFYVGDAPTLPAMLLPTMEEKFLGFMRGESPWPIYVDTEGAMVDTFKLPRGHMGFVILGPDGEIVLRHSGDLDEAKLETIREALGAKEPPPPPPAPDFSVAGFDKAKCAERPCAFVFLSQKVARTDIPRIEGGYEAEDAKDAFAQADKPEIRLATLLAGSWKLEDKAYGLIVGELEGLETDGWEKVAQAPELRAAFEIPENENALVVVDTEGRTAFRAVGLVRMWQMGQAGGALGLEASDVQVDDEE